MPGAEYDAARRRAVEFEFVYAGSVRVAVDQPLHATCAHGGVHGADIRIHNFAGARSRMTPAAGARLLRQLAPQAQWQAQEAPLPAGLAHDAA